MAVSITLHYFDDGTEEGRNFGDALSPLLVSRLSGFPVRKAHPAYAELCATGSILYPGTFWGKKTLKSRVREWMAPNLTIWGSGFVTTLDGKSAGERIRSTRVVAVRGQLTKQILMDGGYAAEGAVLGDPGLLYPMLLDAMPEKRYELGVIPHYTDQVLKRKTEGHVIAVLDEDPFKTLEEIAACHRVVSSSLHGLVVAHALGIPAAYAKVEGIDDFKFRDYFSAFEMGLPQEGDFVIIPHEKVAAVKARLLKTFPYA